MRRLLLVLAVVFATSLITSAISDAATYQTKKKASHKIAATHKASMTYGKSSKMTKAKLAKKSVAARTARGPAFVKSIKMKKSFAARYGKGPSYCKSLKMKKAAVRHHLRKRYVGARSARGPAITCPAPVVNVPQQAAPVVNVPAQAAPVVNVPPAPPTVGITVDNCSIYIVRENQLMILDKNTYQLKQTIPLQQSSAE